VKLYLSGPMSGLPDYNKPEFNRVAAKLRAIGHEVANPAEWDGEATEGWTWNDYIARDLTVLLQGEFEGLVMLAGWESSRGAGLEAHLGNHCLGLPAFDEDMNELCLLTRGHKESE